MKNTLLSRGYNWGLTNDQFNAKYSKSKKRRKRNMFNLDARIVENWIMYSEYCKSKAFKIWKRCVLRKFKHRCVICGKRATIAHHINYSSPWGREKLEDGVAVCQYHHDVFHYDKEVEKMMKKHFD